MIFTGDMQRLAELYEAPYRQNEYYGDFGSVSPVICHLGTIPVLLSAPHATVQWREGKFKEQDDYTGAIAHIVQRYTDCFLIASARFSVQDPNFCEDAYYKEVMEKVVRNHDIQYVIDLHGASANHEFDVELGTGYGQSISEERVQEVVSAFHSYSIGDVRTDSVFPAANQRTVTSFASSRLGVSSIQIELNKRLRSPRENPAGMWAVIHALIGIVKLWGGGNGNGGPIELRRQFRTSSGD